VNDKHEQRTTLLKIGGACAIFGAVVSVAAGVGFGNLTTGAEIEPVLDHIASRPSWFWPLVHLGFMLGAILWVCAFVALADSFERGLSHAFGLMGVAAIIIGAAVHIVDSSIDGFGLSALAQAWQHSPASQQANLLLEGDTLLRILGGTWSGVLCFFHGIPFILTGLAVVYSRRSPTWLGWVGVVGGLGSLLAGMLMFVGASFIPRWLFIIFAVIVSLWMVAMGWLMWRRAGDLTT
jgi:hypothetical protein